MWKRAVRKLGLLLAFLLIFANTFCIKAYAAPDTIVTSGTAKTLTGLSILGLDKPIYGRNLDGTAIIRSAEGVVWEIPVVWVDEDGKPAVVAKPGKKYFPTFTFFLPVGYQAAEVGALGNISVKLPDFLAEQYGTNKVLYVADKSTGLTYISFAGNISNYSTTQKSVSWFDSLADEVAQLTDEEWKIFTKELERAIREEAEASSGNAQTSARVQVQTEDTTSETAVAPASTPESASTPASTPEPTPTPTPEPTPAPTPAPEPEPTPLKPDMVALYCAQSAIEKYDREFLEWLAGYIKNTVQPKAVKYIVDKFPMSYGSAVSVNELSNYIGLYIYEVVGSVNGDAALPDALAYVQGDYNSDGVDFAQIVAVNTKTLTEQGQEGKWRIKETEEANLDNTIVHEMFHAFMNDYTRYGMYRTSGEEGTIASGQGFPNWFVEGSASSVENVYQYRIDIFTQMSVDALADSHEYTTTSVKDGYTNENLTGNNRLDLYYCDEQENTGSAYVAGYLATVYLSNLQAIADDHPGMEVDDAGNISVNMDNIRAGLDHILKRLHGDDENACESLDTIINTISEYGTAANFAEKFIKGDGEDAEGSSLYFASNYLSWLASKAYREGTADFYANGSIMQNVQNYESPINDDLSGDSSIYEIPDREGMILSEINDTRAMTTGGTTRVGPPEPAAQEPIAIAAKAGNDEEAQDPAKAPEAAEEVAEEAAVTEEIVESAVATEEVAKEADVSKEITAEVTTEGAAGVETEDTDNVSAADTEEATDLVPETVAAEATEEAALEETPVATELIAAPEISDEAKESPAIVEPVIEETQEIPAAEPVATETPAVTEEPKASDEEDAKEDTQNNIQEDN